MACRTNLSSRLSTTELHPTNLSGRQAAYQTLRPIGNQAVSFSPKRVLGMNIKFNIQPIIFEVIFNLLSQCHQGAIPPSFVIKTLSHTLYFFIYIKGGSNSSCYTLCLEKRSYLKVYAKNKTP